MEGLEDSVSRCCSISRTFYYLFADSCDFACAEIYAPVCGTDDKTYSNKCSMEREACEQEKKITVASDGECGK